VTKFATLPMA